MLEEIKEYYDAEKTIPWITYFIDEEDLVQKEYKTWYMNGQLETCCFYKNDQLHGEYIDWYMNGQLHIHAFYEDGKLHGPYKRWNIKGQLLKHCIFENDSIHGEYKSWHGNGQLECHFFYIKTGGFIPMQKITDIVKDVSNLTNEEKLLIKLKFNIVCL